MANKGIAVPPGYTSPDVIDRRENAQLKPSMADRVRQLIINVRDEYNESLKGQKPLDYNPLNDAAVQRIHAGVKQLMGSQ